MASADLGELEARARAAYERAALRRALWGTLPMVAAAGLALALAAERETTALLAAFVITFAFGSLWARRGAHTAAALGFFAGLIPYAAAIGASRLVGHVCTPEGCVSACLPACTAGGVVAAAVVARVAARRRAGPLFWLSASAMCVATGALGCSCAGFAGATGMVGGFVATAALSAIARRARG